jgi:hypothetical protein
MLSAAALPVRSGRSKGAGGERSYPFTALLAFLVALLVVLAGTYGGPLPFVLAMLMSCAVMVVLMGYAIRQQREVELSGFLFVPLLISALQNLYLGWGATYLDRVTMQLCLVIHWCFAIVMVLALLMNQKSGVKHHLGNQMLVLTMLLCGYGIFLAAIFGGGFIPLVSSFRNVSTPLLFFLVGCYASTYTRLDVFLRYITMLGWFIVAFGMFEYFYGREIWAVFNIEMLWFKKGIPNMATWGLPLNFVSSEKLFGEHIRRMASSYADPVNFGTVIALVATVAWYCRKYLLMLLALACMVLAVSKGALLGFLIFCVVWTRYYMGRLPFLFMCAFAGAFGTAFLVYSALYSTQSVATHALGLWSAIAQLPSHPLGQGMGNVGVLSGGDTDVRESGLGVVIGQLGVVGILIYGYFFYRLIRLSFVPEERRLKVLLISSVLSILVNIAFNEVALSPNSSAGYFLLFGLALAAAERAAGANAGKKEIHGFENTAHRTH